MAANKRDIKSIAFVIPVFNEEEALDDLFTALKAFKKKLKPTLKIVFVDDHSSDSTPQILKKACAKDPSFSYLRVSRRNGSHAAIIAGLSHCDEDCAAFIAADLQDPLELIHKMISMCEEEYDVIWGNRDGRDGQSWFEHTFSHVFYQIMKRLSHVSNIPFQASFALLSKRAYQGLVKNAGPHTSLIVEIPSLGYPVANIPFSKAKREKGKSKWSVSGKIMALVDAIISSSYVPLRMMTYTGMIVSFIGIVYAIAILFFALIGTVNVAGWASIMIIVLILGGLQILMLGIIGEYLWRVSENTRSRSLYLIEDSCNLKNVDTKL